MGELQIDRRLCIEKDSQFTYLIIFDIFTFKVWSENEVLHCAFGFCLSQQHATNRKKDQ